MRIALKFIKVGLIASLVMPGLANAGGVMVMPGCDGPCPDEVVPANPAPSASASSIEEAKKVINGNETPKFPAPLGPTGGLIEFVTPIKYSKSKSCS